MILSFADSTTLFITSLTKKLLAARSLTLDSGAAQRGNQPSARKTRRNADSRNSESTVTPGLSEPPPKKTKH